MREKLNIPEEHLRTCLQEQYGLESVILHSLPVGLDTKAGGYRVVDKHGTSYFLKVTSRLLYAPSRLIPGYLQDQGITSVVAPLPTQRNALWTKVGDWTVTLYPFIEGDTSWRGMTARHWKDVGTTFKRIHQVMLPSSGFELLRKETFDPTEYSRWIHTFETQQTGFQDGSKIEYALRSCWMAHQPMIHTILTSMEKLAGVLQRRIVPHVICHADLHPGNLLRDRHDHVFVIDWDEVMLAPKERDFLFVREEQVDGSALQDTPSFFQGYGEVEIDWIALTYYRCERVVQDLIVCAQEVFFRDDLGEETKADAVRLFDDIFAEGDEVDAAFAASAHLPAEFNFYSKRLHEGC